MDKKYLDKINGKLTKDDKWLIVVISLLFVGFIFLSDRYFNAVIEQLF